MRIGFIGLGAMGMPMAGRLLDAGLEVTVHNRTRSKEEQLLSKGARRASTPAEASAESDLTIVMVSATADVKEVLFGSQGAASGASSGSIVVDMSTIDPGATATFAQRLAESGIRLLDAPVSGGTEGAKSGTLSIMVGGDPETFNRALPVLQHLGRTIVHIGSHGAGQMAKAVNQVVIAGTYLGLAEGMGLAKRAGLDTAKLISALQAGAASSWILDHRSANMIDRTYPLGFKVALHLKDLRIAIEAAAGSGLRLSGASLVAGMEESLIALGYGDADVSAIAEAVEQIAAPSNSD